MVKRSSSRASDPGTWIGRRDNARAFLKQAEDLLALLGESEPGNPVMTLAVKSVIGFADAITRKFGGMTNTDNHAAVAQTLRGVLRASTEERQLKRLGEMVARKNWIEYGDEAIDAANARNFVEQGRRFARWAETILARENIAR